MTASFQILKALNDEIDTLIGTREEILGGGNAQDFAEYRHVCGQIAGLKLAKQTASSLLRNLERETDE